MNHSRLNSKKAMSQLIAFVLLIGFAIAMAGFVMGWAIPMFKRLDLEKGQEQEMYCNNIQIGIDSACRNETDVKLMVTNKGFYNVTRLTVSRETGNSSMASCLILNVNKDYEDGQGRKFNISIGLGGAIIKRMGILQECSSFNLEGSSDIVLYQISLIPWVDIENEQVSCSDKKVIITDQNILNTYCA